MVSFLSKVVAAALFAVNINASDVDKVLLQSFKDKSEFQKYTKNVNEYSKISDFIKETNILVYYLAVTENKYNPAPIIKEIKRLIENNIARVIEKAKTQNNHFTRDDEKIFFSSLAAHNVLNWITNKDFMKFTGGFDINAMLVDFDIEYIGRQIAQLQNKFNHAA